MGHLVGKDIYRKLAQKIDGTPVRTPDTPAFRALLKALYRPGEADLVARMPYRPATLARIAQVTGEAPDRLEATLNDLCHRGLVLDIWDGSQWLYMVSPLVIGFFEFSMMRTRGDLDHARWAQLFDAYMFGERDFFDANFGEGQQVSIMRAMPHEETVHPMHQSEILDYERASRLIEERDLFAVGLCSCRHEKEHLNARGCDTPLETCTSTGQSAAFLIRNGFARQASREEVRDILQESRRRGLVLSTDNVQDEPGFICHCCGCCCNLLRGVRETGYTGILVSSNYLAQCDAAACNGCGKCVRACPIDAIRLLDTGATAKPGGDAVRAPRKPRGKALIDTAACLGCGVCALSCTTGALTLVPREKRVLHPADSFERVILQSLERNTFQNLVFDNPNSRTQAFMRGLVGGFLRLTPVKRALMSEALRSRFLGAIKGMG